MINDGMFVWAVLETGAIIGSSPLGDVLPVLT